MKAMLTAAIGGVLLVGAAGVSAIAQMDASQQSTMPRNPAAPSIDGRNPNGGEGMPPSLLELQAKMRNNDRQKQMVNDADKLLDLATQLKQEMDKSGKNVSPDDVARKAEEIERLAKSVKDRMKG
ncbi:hypothetical protein GCM10011507_06580 [Edaphobacter acidisoli]|uniref:Uncharacterized protein n=1 Tax=Edaphobacter acidisoli TaxID=2040573 RepID=A0A916RJ32_9BACT|nr:hypothetical protein [Edaphobacter acidisoli]GGA57912.1 hypothetical protein GCM10011507_06580 [Edaphobacter acidisoli]